MKIVKILGGLGNQMFQYALYLSLKETFPQENVTVDLSCFHGYHLHNGFEIARIFSLHPDKATVMEILRIAYYYPNYFFWQIGKRVLPQRKTMCAESTKLLFDKSVLQREGDRYFDGYWQDERYFIDCRRTILNTFKFPPFTDDNNLALLKKMDTNSVSIHVRRGDYVGNKLYQGICDLNYYREAIMKISSYISPSMFCDFSNDIEWCRDNLESFIKAPIYYVDWNSGTESYRDMQLMSCCGHNIIANSSFSWWGAWLNQNSSKIVIAPKRWINLNNCGFMLPSRWVKI